MFYFKRKTVERPWSINFTINPNMNLKNTLNTYFFSKDAPNLEERHQQAAALAARTFYQQEAAPTGTPARAALAEEPLPEPGGEAPARAALAARTFYQQERHQQEHQQEQL
ncbi:unnamed protein product [Rhizophagus irregularis]|nr:unnamed protein product [Rhizophagus irregularis]